MSSRLATTAGAVMLLVAAAPARPCLAGDDGPTATLALAVQSGRPLHIALDERSAITGVGQLVTGDNRNAFELSAFV